MSKPRCPYAVLGVARTAAADDIARSYRKAALQLHPDRNPDAGAEPFKELCAAYEILSDPVKRGIYDATGVRPGSEDTVASTDDPETVAARAAQFGAEIDAFFVHYRNSSDERHDLVENYTTAKGDFDVIMRAFAIFDNRHTGEAARILAILQQALDEGAIKATKRWKVTTSPQSLRSLEASLAAERKKADAAAEKKKPKIRPATSSSSGKVTTSADGDDDKDEEGLPTNAKTRRTGDVASLALAMSAKRKQAEWLSMTDGIFAKYCQKKPPPHAASSSKKKKSNRSEEDDDADRPAPRRKK